MEPPTPEPDRIPIVWQPRAIPLEPIAVIAFGAVARALGSRLLRTDPATHQRLRGVAGDQVLVVLGAAADLPWADGVTYLGRSDLAPSLLLPTQLEPACPLPLLEAALLRRLDQPAPPIAVLNAPPLLVSTGAARPIEAARLQAWLAEHS